MLNIFVKFCFFIQIATAQLTLSTTLANVTDYNTTAFGNGSIAYNQSSNTYTLSDYVFSVNLTLGDNPHTSANWTREVRFGKCRDAAALTADTSDSCAGTEISGVGTITNNLNTIQGYDLIGSCADVTWYDGAGTADVSLTWWISYAAAKPVDNAPGVFEYTCVEQQYSVDYMQSLAATATFTGSPDLVSTVISVRVLSANMLACDVAGEYKLTWDVLLTLSQDPNGGADGFMPYSVKPSDGVCHYQTNDTDLTTFSTNSVEMLTSTHYRFNMSTSCRQLSGECDRFQFCESGSNGIDNYGIVVQFQRGDDTQATTGIVAITLKHDECPNVKTLDAQTIGAETMV